MPHATKERSNNMTNGDMQSSKTLSHVTSYPVVNDAIETFKSYPIGKKSIEIADEAYQRFGKPVEPYLETPYSYAKPYVQKADELADSGLKQVDTHFPIVTEDTNTIIDTAKSYAFWPYNYAVNTYNDEYRKTANHGNRGDTITTLLMATVSFQLRVASDFFQALSEYLGPKYEESKKKSADYLRQAQDTAEDYAHNAQDKMHEYQQIGQQKFDDYSKQGQQKVDEYSKLGQQKADEYSKKGEEYSKMSQQKAEDVVKQAQQGKENVKGQAHETKEQAKGAAKDTKEEAKARAGQK
ncbi:hypothetical protein BAUCODRAFT_34609 [Baudoinia panamericana UAMH 10762]|uniref:Uncharacterized protein n=1 Tax=Baudoinia panamericana (strain UAMH 10762) TaxID=717646 RepID=M2NAG3_BAUPA|nr:uncharacterized protein BAUCODRAFT_34609 [Baudoinia panamericana UAMH 10762]EMC95840.1 hypothetical protein BAUCODRAFT_34609 [Baudoinia panamericana UAMH 10762]